MWRYCEKESPEVNVPVIIYRPQTMYPRCHEKPLAVATFNGTSYSCHIQPLMWKAFQLPSDWSDDHNKYQKS